MSAALKLRLARALRAIARVHRPDWRLALLRLAERLAPTRVTTTTFPNVQGFWSVASKPVPFDPESSDGWHSLGEARNITFTVRDEP